MSARSGAKQVPTLAERALRRASVSSRKRYAACRLGAAAEYANAAVMGRRRGKSHRSAVRWETLPSVSPKGITAADQDGQLSDPAKSQNGAPRGELTVRTIAMPADTNANGDIFGKLC